MVFWKSYNPLYNTSKFTTQLSIKSILDSPTGFAAEIATNYNEIKEFLHAYFRIHPDVVYDASFEKTDFILIVRDKEKLVGCIRYHLVGTIEQPIHLVDCFCIHPEWRRKGVGDYLLHNLHHRMKDKPYAIFLKEGAPLPIQSFYNSIYVYRHVLHHSTSHVTTIPIKLAYRLLTIYQQFNSFLMIAIPSSNQIWRLYKHGHCSILACIQDTRQTLHDKKMGWITAWIESPGITDIMRKDASYQLSEVDQFDLIWMDWRWINYSTDKNWIVDGPFYWYTYQWTSSILIHKSYCFIH